MEKRMTRKRRLHFETMERREAATGGLMLGHLSALAHRAPVHRAPPQQNGTPFQGAGLGMLINVMQLPNGGVSVTGNFSVQTNIGNFTGPIGINLIPSRGRVTGTVTLQDASNNQLNVSLSGSARGNTANGTFTITGGSGMFAGASGRGNANGSLDLSSNAVMFSFKGTIKKPA